MQPHSPLQLHRDGAHLEAPYLGGLDCKCGARTDFHMKMVKVFV
jgi:hypothetical protein